MVQFFAKGTKSASEVNYGEYVLIDTITNCSRQNDPDNGKVFRRGMNIDSELAGAEYIGNIVGPKGDTAELGLDNPECYDTNKAVAVGVDALRRLILKDRIIKRIKEIK